MQNYDWDWQTADKEFRRAIELNPNCATAHHWYSEHLALLGRFDEALRESESARGLDPLSLIIATDNAMIFYFARQYDRAIDQLRAVQKMDPAFEVAHRIEQAYVEKGMFKEALEDEEEWRRGNTSDFTWILSSQAYIYGRSGQQTLARSALEKLERLNHGRQMDPWPILLAQIGIGDRDQVFAWLEKAYSQHSNSLTTLKVEPVYDPFRSDPRFQDLLRRVGLS